MKFPTLDPKAVAGLRHKSLLTTSDYADAELDALLAVASAFQALDFAGIRADLFPAELAYALFFDNSTRTKSAWAGAAARLGMHPVIVDGSSTQVSHGETAVETGAMLGMNAHALGVRHDLILGQGQTFIRDVRTGIEGYLAATNDERTVPIVNLQCDVDHPTQSLADLLFLREKLGSLAGKKIAVSWAYSPSYAKPLSVPQGLVTLLSRYGADLVLAHPEGYELLDEPMRIAKENAERTGGSLRVTHSMDEAFEDAVVVYPKSWGPLDLMRARAAAKTKDELAEIERRALERNARHKDWICDERRMGLTSDSRAQYMHCLPADIGAEVSPGVMETYRIDLAREANKKVYVIMAMLATAKADDLAQRLSSLGNERK